MTPTAKRRVLGTLAAAAVAAWRLLGRPPEALWRDWVLLLAVYAAYLAWETDDRRRSTATLAVMTFLLGVYVAGVAPLLLSVFPGGG